MQANYTEDVNSVLLTTEASTSDGQLMWSCTSLKPLLSSAFAAAVWQSKPASQCLSPIRHFSECMHSFLAVALR